MSKSKIIAFTLLGLALLLIVFNLPLKKGSTSRTTFISDSYPAEKAKEEELLLEMPVLEDTIIPLAEEQHKEMSPSFSENLSLKPISDDKDLPAEVDLMAQLFQPYPPILPIVETLSYSGKVDWLTGRTAYLGDYATHYQTSKHFISRSLHGFGNYLSDRVSKGDRFNVFRKDKEIEFHLVLDISRLKLWLYCYDKTDDSRFLLKAYPVCAGRLDKNRRSGSLTPLGTFSIGKEISVNELGVMGSYKNELRELITVFGVRWIPFGREVANCTGSSKGLGLHGVPWKKNPETQEIFENRECIGHYESGGCIRLLTEDIEEIYAVIASKPSFIHVVRDFCEASLPGVVKELVFK